MKIDFEGVTRVLDLDHIKLRHAVAIQEFTGLPLLDWTRALVSRDGETMTALSDPGWIMNMAAAHWLMLAQAGETVPPLDGDYDCEVLDFALAVYQGALDEVKARQVPDKPDPTAPRARRTPSSRRTAAPKKPITVTAIKLSGPLPRTGS